MRTISIQISDVGYRFLRVSKNLMLLLVFNLSLLTLVAQTSTWDGSASPWTKGSGTENDPYLIESAANLAYLSQRVAIESYGSFSGEYFKLTTNINLNNIEWIPIGGRNMQGEESSSNWFNGSFDGNNKTIANIYINASTKNLTGLFGFIFESGSTIQNIKIISGTIIGKMVGGIVGIGSKCKIINCENSASIKSSLGGGGIAGSVNNNAIIVNCINYGMLTAENSTASLSGIVSNSANSSYIVKCINKGNITGYQCAGIINIPSGVTIEDCYNSGNIACSQGGGIVHSGGSDLIIRNCYNTGNITASYEGGGIICHYSNYLSTIITNCYNTGTLSGNNGKIGGIASEANAGSISNCYNIGTIEGNNNGAIVAQVSSNPTITNCHYLSTCIGTNNGYGTSQTSATMKSQGFVNTLNGSQNPKAWYLNSSLNNGYPSLIFLPFVETLSATSITSNSAVLNGNIFQGSENITSKGFRYKKYGTSSYTTIPVTGSNFVATISCEANSGYLFQAYATTASGTVYGNELSFTTPILQTFVETLDATSITSNSATLNGKLIEGSDYITAKGFRYRKFWTYEYTTVPVTGNIFFTTISCEPNSSYYFQAYATTTSETIYGDELSFTTLTNGINETFFSQPQITTYSNQINICFENISPFYTEVFDMLGKINFQGSFNGNTTIIVPQSGIYFVRLYYNNQIFTQKVAIY